MLMLKDIRSWIAGLGVAADNNVYIGKLDNKRQKSIGVYSRPTSGPRTLPWVVSAAPPTQSSLFPCSSTGIRVNRIRKKQQMRYLRN